MNAHTVADAVQEATTTTFAPFIVPIDGIQVIFSYAFRPSDAPFPNMFFFVSSARVPSPAFLKTVPTGVANKEPRSVSTKIHS